MNAELNVEVVGERTDIIKNNGQTDFFCCPIIKLGSSYYAAPDCRQDREFHEGQQIEIDPDQLEEVEEEDLEYFLF